jgi:hypothetical protein
MKNITKQENIIKQIHGRVSISVNPELAVKKGQEAFVKDTIAAWKKNNPIPLNKLGSVANAEKFLKDLYKECEKSVPKEEKAAKAPSK